MQPDHDPLAEPAPASIGKYPVIRAIGQGATSRVYLAEAPFSAQRVAIKLVQRDPAASDEVRRQIQSAFLNEAALAGKLKHPHIAAIHDAVNDGDCSYIAMEYVAGGTLEQHCNFDALLTGKPPFQGSNRESLLYQIVSIDPARPALHRPDLPPAIERIVLRALAKSRENRYPEWRDFAADLEGLFGHLKLPEQDMSEAERFSVLRQLPLFQGFGDVEIWETLRIGLWHGLPAGASVIREGEICGGFFVIAAGNVRVSRDGQQLDTLGAGQFFGDVLYFENSVAPRGTSVASSTPGLLLEIKGESLRRASAACQVQFNQALLRMLVKRVERGLQAR